MEILDWFFIVLFSLAILSLIFSIAYLIFSLVTKKNINTIKSKRVKNKRKRKKLIRKRKKLEAQKKKQIKLGVIFLLSGVLFISGAFYSRYYQATNLGKKDSDAIVQGYYLIHTIEQQLGKVDDEENAVRTQKNLYDLSARLSSYGARSADGRLSQQGQMLLNRLYSAMKELGLNLSNQSVDTLRRQEIMESYKKDIQKTKTNQKKVFDYFDVDEKALNQKK
ncbi:hypothetical protein [Candidatus Enterococcus mansonii]|uniref:Uncharacterized protein n=1 Tax=Candidatus Enterococcus mansonii TaxID=1834181 RepID=A0A242CFB0_9ENTE|nr:hypothetical protein [Enterococcus sp. 4G2_DIV0659]OTO08944.1 hypothetical protein A5880_001944 [Enterococcus sp. 4G2_DIV0659]